jgi:toxin ParE1/3/4
MKVVFTRPAVSELEQIARHVERDNPAAAERLVLEIRSRCLGLSDGPERGRVVGRRRGVEIRRLVYRPYLIFYSVRVDAVRIHRVIHGSRSPGAFLKNIDPF